MVIELACAIKWIHRHHQGRPPINQSGSKIVITLMCNRHHDKTGCTTSGRSFSNLNSFTRTKLARRPSSLQKPLGLASFTATRAYLSPPEPTTYRKKIMERKVRVFPSVEGPSQHPQEQPQSQNTQEYVTRENHAGLKDI